MSASVSSRTLNALLGEPPTRSEGDGGQQEPFTSLDTFHNLNVPKTQVLHERPEHRLLIYAKAKGLSNGEIAEWSGYNQGYLSILFRQPWCAERIAQIQNAAGLDPVKQCIKSAAPDCVQVLVELAMDEEQPGSVRKSAASDIVDRYLGRPHQHVEVVQTQASGTEDVAELEKEIKSLEEQENRLLGKN